MKETLNREGELEEKIERVDEESKEILAKDGVGTDMLEKIKEFFSKFPLFSNANNKKKEEL